MKTIGILLLLVSAAVAQIGVGAGVGVGVNIGLGIPPAGNTDTYRSMFSPTQVHASANHWGNSNSTHTLLDSITLPVAMSVSRASWNTLAAGSASDPNIYDVAWVCLAGSCQVGKMYAHTGPILASQTNPAANTQTSRALVADQNTVCTSYPCTLPPGMYNVATGSSDLAANTMSIWGDGSGRASGGAEFHIANSFGDIDNAFIASTVTSQPTNTPSGGNTQVTVTSTMLNGQAMLATPSGTPPHNNGYLVGQTVLVAGLKDAGGTGLAADPCNGLKVLTAVTGTTATGTLTWITTGTHTCSLTTDVTAKCNGVGPTNIGGTNFGTGCIGAGIAPTFDQLLVDQGNGYFCYADGSECGRTDFVGPAGPQSGAHSVGINIF